MCWASNNLRIKTAKKNIPVWKVVYPTNYDFPNRCCSLYTRFVYVKGDLEMTPMNFEVRMSIVNGNVGLSSPEFTPADCPTMDDRGTPCRLKSSDRLKQEKNEKH